MAVTIKDVARVAGVSPSTVCRALSTPNLVRDETCDRVRRAAADLGYSPNRAARGLITGRTANIGLIVPDLGNPFFPGVVKGIQARAREADYAVFLADTDEDPAAETQLVRTLAKQVDGLVLCSPRMSEQELRGFAAETPLVMLNRRVGRLPAITFANVDGMRQAVTHLTALGHRRIAYVAGPRTSWSNRERARGLRAAAASAGAALVEVGPVLPQFDGGVAAADPVLAAGVTAVIAYNDVIALGLLSRLHARGIAVPAEISVIGFDDIPMAAMVHPSLTTVGLPMESCGRAGVDLLLGLLQDPARYGTTRRELGTHLMVRGSTGAPPNA
ncbi:LacI family DNA-binding transcriptional regulator [Amorphoplanes digitatis]|uniref:DNA-binding LacI/PurR family transcriptional regulator n=1 Tax=Actinoplanes digitatis TaxID=1868 RepID=A0A7W7MPY8_9ACTN|nr:LacI family DNA-binding transcriptional regulator [Actinoplanes digitatis]MBB4762636.1 DNA-binding LacI/PurR family transcriptional regulator [Actinoplanes digitatis]GID91864.1 LacI family transcriptional regulator [Actinoplanes digitatis]